MTLNDLKARINAIEEGYEFFLAYAAQGLAGDQAGKSGEQVRGVSATASKRPWTALQRPFGPLAGW